MLHWQTLVGIALTAIIAGLGASLTQYPVDKVPHWIPIALAVAGAIGTALKNIGITTAVGKPTTHEAPGAPVEPKAEVPK
jgi:uncharacterized membrane protein